MRPLETLLVEILLGRVDHVPDPDRTALHRWPAAMTERGRGEHHQSNNQARKLVRESQTRANEKRAQRERDNVEDLGRRLEESGPLTYVTP